MAFVQQHSPETIARVRDQYAAGERIEVICRANKMSRHALYYWVDGGPKFGPDHLPPLPRRGGETLRQRRRFSGNRLALVKRIWRTAEGQVRDIEDRLAAAEQEPIERERDARMLAVLVKTLRELAAIDEAEKPPKPSPTSDDDNDPVPTDIDEFRRELARRMDALVAARTADAAGESQ
jgi:hypothetical protein